LRAYLKSTIFDLGYADFSEWFIGHAGSTYYRRSQKEIDETFARIEPYLMFLDVEALEASQSDMRSEIETLKRRLATVKAEVASMPSTIETAPIKDRVKAAATRSNLTRAQHKILVEAARLLKELEGS
jgi:hypothetical protein